MFRRVQNGVDHIPCPGFRAFGTFRICPLGGLPRQGPRRLEIPHYLLRAAWRVFRSKNYWRVLSKINLVSGVCQERHLREGEQSAVVMFHMFGSMNMYSWDGCLPGAYTWGKKKERNVRNLHWRGGGEGKSPAFPAIRRSVHLNLGGRGFSSHSVLMWARSNCYYCYCY